MGSLSALSHNLPQRTNDRGLIIPPLPPSCHCRVQAAAPSSSSTAPAVQPLVGAPPLPYHPQPARQHILNSNTQACPHPTKRIPNSTALPSHMPTHRRLTLPHLQQHPGPSLHSPLPTPPPSAPSSSRPVHSPRPSHEPPQDAFPDSPGSGVSRPPSPDRSSLSSKSTSDHPHGHQTTQGLTRGWSCLCCRTSGTGQKAGVTWSGQEQECDVGNA